MKKIMALGLAMTFAALLSVAVEAQARGKDDVPPAPECQVEDGGIVVCK